MARRTMFALAVAVAVVAGAACSNDGPNAAPTPEPNAVTIQGFLFKPPTLSVQAGRAVIWTNRDDIAHTVTSGKPSNTTDVFDSGDKTLGQAFTHTFPAAGTFEYFCKNHNSMTGRVTVT